MRPHGGSDLIERSPKRLDSRLSGAGDPAPQLTQVVRNAGARPREVKRTWRRVPAPEPGCPNAQPASDPSRLKPALKTHRHRSARAIAFAIAIVAGATDAGTLTPPRPDPRRRRAYGSRSRSGRTSVTARLVAGRTPGTHATRRSSPTTRRERPRCCRATARRRLSSPARAARSATWLAVSDEIACSRPAPPTPCPPLTARTARVMGGTAGVWRLRDLIPLTIRIARSDAPRAPRAAGSSDPMRTGGTRARSRPRRWCALPRPVRSSPPRQSHAVDAHLTWRRYMTATASSTTTISARRCPERASTAAAPGGRPTCARA